MLVWRYENAAGRGPYTGKTPVGHEILVVHNDYTAHPGAPQDGLDNVNWNDWICGMDSRRGLTKWFWRFNKRLREAGYQVKVFEVLPGDYQVSARTGQVAFRRNTS